MIGGALRFADPLAGLSAQARRAIGKRHGAIVVPCAGYAELLTRPVALAHRAALDGATEGAGDESGRDA